MRHHKQLFRHDPANGVYGDCFRTAVACLLDLDPQLLPHDHCELEDGEQMRRMNAWLARRDLVLINFGFPADRPVADLLASMVHAVGRECRFLLSGASPRGTCHVVVAHPTGIIHDPHPDGGGLVGPCPDGFWHITFVGALV